MSKTNFFDHPYYRLNKMFLSYFGTWPEQSLFIRCLMPSLITISIISIFVPEIVRLVEVTREHDADTIMECLPPMMVMGVALAQEMNGAINRTKMNTILKRIVRDWDRLGQSPNIEIIHKYAARGHFITKTYSIGMYLAATLYMVMPTIPIMLDTVLNPNNSTREIFLFETDYGIDTYKYYWYLLAHSYVLTALMIVIIISNDVMFFVTVEHACGLFEIVGVNLMRVKNESTVDNDSRRDKGYEMICGCLNLHKEAIFFADLIESSYTTCLLGVVGFCLIILSVSGVQTVMHSGELEQVVRYGSFSIAQVFHLYFNSVPGQKLIDYSLSIFDYAYEVNWEDLSPKAAKLLIMMMIRSQRPCQLTAGKIYIVSMENYSSVMQTSMSYFTVLTSMR